MLGGGRGKTSQKLSFTDLDKGVCMWKCWEGCEEMLMPMPQALGKYSALTVNTVRLRAQHWRWICCCCSVARSCPTLCNHELQHTRLPCPSLSPGVCQSSCPLSQWCHPTISSSSSWGSFSSCLQSFPVSGSSPMSWLFTSGGQIIAASASTSVLSDYSGLISFKTDWFFLLAVQGTLKTLPTAPLFESISSPSVSLLYGPVLTSMHDYWKNHSFDYMDQHHNHRKLTKMIMWITALCNSVKLRAMWCRATQDRWVIVERSDTMWSTGEGNGKPVQYARLQSPRSSVERRWIYLCSNLSSTICFVKCT